MLRIKIKSSVRTNKIGYEFLVNLYHQILSQEEFEIILDFSICFRFDANLSSALGALLDLLIENGYCIWLANFKVGVRRTLARNNFLKSVGHSYKGIDDKETFIPYKRFSRDETDQFKQYIQDELICKRDFPAHTDLAGEQISISISEVFVNAATHGNCSSVFCCGEYFQGKIPKLNMTVVDCGDTINNKVNQYFKHRGLSEVKADKAIEWAIIKRNTTKENTGGLGLSTLIEFIRLNSGCLHILSSNALLLFKNGKIKTILLKKPFPGTIVNMEFNFNDNNFYHIQSEISNLSDLL